MPIWEPSLVAAGFSPSEVPSAINTVLPATLDASFLLHLGPLADIIPIPLPLIQNVASLGDLFIMFGLAFFLFAAVVRTPDDIDDTRRQRPLAGDRHASPRSGGRYSSAASARAPRP